MPIPPQDPAPFDAAPPPDPAQAASARDAGVRRVRRTTRWLLAGAIGLTGAIAGVAAQQTLPANTSDATGGTSASAAPSDDGAAYSDDDGSYSGDGGYAYDDDDGYSGSVQAPTQAPQSASQSTAPSVSSGAS